MTVPRSRVLDLMKVQCRIFNTVFNPDRLRLGTKILRQRLRGPSVASYYPERKGTTLRDLRRAYPEFEIDDDYEEDRTEALAVRTMRGKGAPKKKRTADDKKGKKKKR